jgi:hypothetical protein
MEDLEIRREELALKGVEAAASRERIRESLGGLTGVEELAVGPNRLSISYYPQIVSFESIQHEIENLGYAVDRGQKKPGRFQRFLEDMAANNARFFGGEKPDCCTLNRRKPTR